jgi:hypothetical protein
MVFFLYSFLPFIIYLLNLIIFPLNNTSIFFFIKKKEKKKKKGYINCSKAIEPPIDHFEGSINLQYPLVKLCIFFHELPYDIYFFFFFLNCHTTSTNHSLCNLVQLQGPNLQLSFFLFFFFNNLPKRLYN